MVERSQISHLNTKPFFHQGAWFQCCETASHDAHCDFCEIDFPPQYPFQSVWKQSNKHYGPVWTDSLESASWVIMSNHKDLHTAMVLQFTRTLKLHCLNQIEPVLSWMWHSLSDSNPRKGAEKYPLSSVKTKGDVSPCPYNHLQLQSACQGGREPLTKGLCGILPVCVQ